MKIVYYKNLKLKNHINLYDSFLFIKIQFVHNKNMVKKVIIGLSAGFVSGFFATGGGMVLVPAFTFLNLSTQRARGTAIFCILPMVITSSIFYYKSNYIDWKISILCAVGGSIGGYIGAKLLKKLPEIVLKITFILFLIYIAFRIII